MLDLLTGRYINVDGSFINIVDLLVRIHDNIYIFKNYLNYKIFRFIIKIDFF